MSILCIDPSSSITGFAIIPAGHQSIEDIVSGRIMAKADDGDKDPGMARVWGIVEQLLLFIEQYQVKEVFIENNSQYAGPNTTEEVMELLITLKRLIKSECLKKGIKFWPVAPMSIKSTIMQLAMMRPVGRSATKDEVIIAVRKLSLNRVFDNNHADAYALARVVIFRGDDFRLTPVEKRALKRAKKFERETRQKLGQTSLFS